VLPSVPFVDIFDHTDSPTTYISQTNLGESPVTCNLPSEPIIHSPLPSTVSRILEPPTAPDHVAPLIDVSVQPRRSTRTLKTPTHMTDYVHSIPQLKSPKSISLQALFTNHHYLAHTALHPNSQTFVRNVCIDREPSSYKEAAIDPAWQHAMTQEFDALHSNHTWDLVPLPHGKKAIGCKWVYKVKHKADGGIERLKARLVVKGYTQQAGIDYTETFSPVVKMTTVRALLITAVKQGWDLYQLDVNNAFLHGDLHEEVYMEVPPGLAVSSSTLVCKLNKSLYGLKQASRQWYAKLTEALCSRGYTHSMYDYSLFYKKKGTSAVYVAVYVDDIVLTGTNKAEIDDLKLYLDKRFKIKDLGLLNYFLGMEVLHTAGGIIISQRKFVLDLLKEYDCLHCSPLSSPLDPTVKLRAHEGPALNDSTYYRKLIGKLNFLSNTRLDIAFSVQHLSQFMQDLREPHLQAAFHLLRYMKSDPTLGLFLSKDADFTIKRYYYSD